jgi:hypothetical protein
VAVQYIQRFPHVPDEFVFEIPCVGSDARGGKGAGRKSPVQWKLRRRQRNATGHVGIGLCQGYTRPQTGDSGIAKTDQSYFVPSWPHRDYQRDLLIEKREIRRQYPDHGVRVAIDHQPLAQHRVRTPEFLIPVTGGKQESALSVRGAVRGLEVTPNRRPDSKCLQELVRDEKRWYFVRVPNTGHCGTVAVPQR